MALTHCVWYHTASSGTVSDLMGKGASGTVQGTTTSISANTPWVTSAGDNYVAFVGNSYINAIFAMDSVTFGDSVIAMCCDIYPVSAAPSQTVTCMSWGSNNVTTAQWTLTQHISSGLARTRLNAPDLVGNNAKQGASAISANTRHSLMTVIEGNSGAGKLRLWADGVEIGSPLDIQTLLAACTATTDTQAKVSGLTFMGTVADDTDVPLTYNKITVSNRVKNWMALRWNADPTDTVLNEIATSNYNNAPLPAVMVGGKHK